MNGQRDERYGGHERFLDIFVDLGDVGSLYLVVAQDDPKRHIDTI